MAFCIFKWPKVIAYQYQQNLLSTLYILHAFFVMGWGSWCSLNPVSQPWEPLDSADTFKGISAKYLNWNHNDRGFSDTENHPSCRHVLLEDLGLASVKESFFFFFFSQNCVETRVWYFNTLKQIFQLASGLASAVQIIFSFFSTERSVYSWLIFELHDDLWHSTLYLHINVVTQTNQTGPQLCINISIELEVFISRNTLREMHQPAL